jgi:hypothetical protein
MSLRRTITVTPSAHELADALWKMTTFEQAAFFNRLSVVCGHTLLALQMMMVVESPNIDADGLAAMDIIGDARTSVKGKTDPEIKEPGGVE